MNDGASKILEYGDKYNLLSQGWLKNLAVLSIGALTILVGLMPKGPLPSPDKYFLAACWCLLGLSILGSLIGSFLPIALAGLNLKIYTEPQKWHGEEPFPKEWKAHRIPIMSFFQKVGIVSFFLAFMNLVVFACLTTLKT